jgi:hypothetical protein
MDQSDGHLLFKSTVVTSGQQYDDLITWGSNATTYYRNQNKAPCEFILHQAMAMYCDSSQPGNWEYAANTTEASIGTTLVGSCKNGFTAPFCLAIVWP